MTEGDIPVDIGKGIRDAIPLSVGGDENEDTLDPPVFVGCIGSREML